MRAQSTHSARLGTIGYLAVFFGLILAVMIVPLPFLPWAACGGLAVAWLVFPQVLNRLIRLRLLVMIVVFSLPPVFLLGEPDRSFFGILYSSVGLLSGMQIALRILVILVAVQGLTGSVDISSLAGLLERCGLRGLGFSFGIALNLLPSLQQSAQNAWRSLWMRGGLRRKRWRGIRLLAVSITSNALKRAEEIALAAEVRAYSPENHREMKVQTGRWDYAMMVVSAMIIVALIMIH